MNIATQLVKIFSWCCQYYKFCLSPPSPRLLCMYTYTSYVKYQDVMHSYKLGGGGISLNAHTTYIFRFPLLDNENRVSIDHHFPASSLPGIQRNLPEKSSLSTANDLFSLRQRTTYSLSPDARSNSANSTAI
ncbi:hypothetical protein ACRALDRAFT_205216 [Sodiomyces alcalophilus JCM 7366]|uniref:uncharacterized protein n=1 Tax=Sodiomyces alcalophilus JCM 7366 TaxID=591952 RepID=UPI0039B4717F